MLGSRICTAQIILSGVVYDSSKINYVEGVLVLSTGGKAAVTDSMGRYSLPVSEADSISFTFRDKPTQKFAVKIISDYEHFDIALRVRVKSKYNTMREVVVYGKSYHQDSMENRETYRDVFEYQKPRLSIGTNPDGISGIDPNQIINMFRFKRNKHMLAFQGRLEEQERQKYIDYRFNKSLVKRITGLEPPLLDSFMVRYRPDSDSINLGDDLILNQYILNCWYKFKVQQNISGTAAGELKRND